MKKNLPIKVVIPRERDIEKNQPGGDAKIFRPISSEFISDITGKFGNVLDYYNDVFKFNPNTPAVAKLVIREDAVAKSHRPNDLCQDLEIIGAGSLQEIHVKTTKNGLIKTINRINKPYLSKKMQANLSTIVDIKPFYPEDKIAPAVRNLISENNTDTIKELKIKPFKFDGEYDNVLTQRNTIEELKKLNYQEIKHSIFGKSLEYFTLFNVKKLDIEKIANMSGVKYLDIFQEYTMPKKVSASPQGTVIDGIVYEESDLIIGIIDSGISESTVISKDVIGRKEYVPKNYQNRNHGTFVASSLQMGSVFDGKKEITRKKFKFYDVVAIPNSDKDYGMTDTLSQSDLFDIIEEVMNEKSHEIKIWNLSLGTDELVVDDSISDLAIFFDYIQDKFDVQFILACGNYEDLPLRFWPAQDLLNLDRITVPADSARAISVGSIALKDNEVSLVKANQPSPFSRKGPGANYMVKPELVDFGGNMTIAGDITGVGVLGLNENGDIVEGVGTSYSTPKISYKYAKIFDELVEKNPLIAKGFLIHDARISSKSLEMESDEIKYYGFGQPSLEPQNILNCSDNEISLVFKQSITKGNHLAMWNFPYPKSLIKNNKYTGEIFMTLVYNPPLDERYGSQYCRVNFDAHFGTYTPDKNGKIVFNGQVPLEETWDEKYEESRVKHGFKWSPVKSYYRDLKRGINAANGWKVRIDMHERSELDNNTHEFLLIITIRGNVDDPVYNDVVVDLQNQGFITANLETRQQIRERN